MCEIAQMCASWCNVWYIIVLYYYLRKRMVMMIIFEREIICKKAMVSFWTKIVNKPIIAECLVKMMTPGNKRY